MAGFIARYATRKRASCDMSNKSLILPLFDLGVPDPLSWEPIYNGRDLQNGLYVAERYLGFSLADIALLFRHSRGAARPCAQLRPPDILPA
jgi:hypothetical protein